jgi:2-polyprenyl-3-methyl-5-hydroxy-6-metoxy-1,4-benzoquinol methylase
MSTNGFFSKAKSKLSSEVNLLLNSIRKFRRSLYSDQHQLTSTTGTNRYPELFTAVKVNLNPGKERISILSFGCSTGEECFSLRDYFKSAHIIGADINKSNLTKAKKKNVDENVNFIFSTPENLKQQAPYEIIFCLSVLCRWEDTRYVDNCRELYPFEKFEGTVAMLSDLLAPDGLLVIYNSNFAFEDTVVFKKEEYSIVSTPAVPDSGFVYKFDKECNRVPQTHKACVYRKA